MDNKEIKSDIPSCVILQTPLDVLRPGKIKLGEKKKQLAFFTRQMEEEETAMEGVGREVLPHISSQRGG